MSNYTERESRVLRQRARDALISAGHRRQSLKTQAGIVYAIEVEMGNDCQGEPLDFIKAWLDSRKAPARKVEPPKHKPLQRSAQWEINVARASKAQPKLWTPNGIGNGLEGQHGYGRGA